MVEIPTIQTARLMLRTLCATDAVILHRIYQTDGVLDYFPIPTSPPLNKVDRFIAGQQEH